MTQVATSLTRAQLREATQKAQLFEAIIEQVKKNTGVDPLKKPLGRSSHKRSSRD